ncbi:MAG: NADPH:quinone reductase [Haliea sp.]|uniref:NADPH:quinone reductase n=1 Tax=Haliea sp. TaxID=1932666 RepID=UPI0032ED6D92
MQAAWFESFGAAADTLVLGELPRPEPAPGEVLVKLYTSAVNPSDVKKRAGAFPKLLDDGLVIPHSDGAGVIAAVGEGVDPARIGERVFVYQAQYGRRFGTAAEYVALEAVRAPRLPDEASFEVGACIGIPIMTAHRCVFADGDVAGQTVLVTGGAGRVGYYAIQWAKLAGARVIATASNDSDAALCREMGADEVVNHREAGWGLAAIACNNGKNIDRLVEVDFGANLSEVLQCIRIGGTIATYSSSVAEPQLPFRDMMFMDLTVRMVIVYAMPEEAKTLAVEDTCAALQAGRLQHRIAHSVPFGDMVRAHELIEQGGFGGCVVVNVNA